MNVGADHRQVIALCPVDYQRFVAALIEMAVQQGGCRWEHFGQPKGHCADAGRSGEGLMKSSGCRKAILALQVARLFRNACVGQNLDGSGRTEIFPIL